MSENTNKSPLILALETSGRLGSACLAQGGQLLEEISFSSAMRHSAELFPAMASLLEKFGKKPDEIEHVYISVGPGSFTGLRIAVTLAKTMHLANNNVKIIAVDTLDVIAANVIDTGDKADDCERIAVILDAKRNQFFTAVYERKQGRWEKTLTDCLIGADEFTDKFADADTPIWLLGEGLVYYKDKFKRDGVEIFDEKFWWPKASKVHTLGLAKALKGNFSEAIGLEPNYLRKVPVGSSKLLQNR